jgi:hypothetical protein
LRTVLHAGAGIGMLATYSAAEDLRSGALMRVLPQYRLRVFQIYAVYASRRYLDAKIRTLLEHLRATLSPALEQVRHEVEALASAQTTANAGGLPGTPSKQTKSGRKI